MRIGKKDNEPFNWMPLANIAYGEAVEVKYRAGLYIVATCTCDRAFDERHVALIDLKNGKLSHLPRSALARLAKARIILDD